MNDLQRLRHSCAHIMATAVVRIWPDALLDIGPPTEEGFYYDFDLPGHRFAPEDFAKIEAEMQKVVKENQTFDKSLKSRDEAKAFFEQRGQKYKVERLADIPESAEIRKETAQGGPCRLGPEHVRGKNSGKREEQPSEVDDTPGRRDPEQDPSGGAEKRAPDNEDGTATGNPGAAGAS